MIVTFSPNNVKQFATKGENLMDVASKVDIIIDGNCGSTGKCGKCKVKVIAGKVAVPDEMEKSTLSDKEIIDGYRLACRITVEDDLHIVVPTINNASSRKTALTYIPNDFVPANSVKKYYLNKVEPASLINQTSDIERILQALPEEGYTIAPSLLIDIPELINNEYDITVAANDNHIIDIERGDTSDKCYGIAYDIGTTTVVGMLWDLNKGQLIGVTALTNPQSVFGADVISRINYSSDPKNLKLMKSKVRDCFNEIINYFIEKYDIQSNHIYEGTVVGNTTMSHLFLGVNPTQLAKSPFVPVFTLPVDIKAKNLELNMNPLAVIHLLPNIAGHVGSDIVGVLLASRLMSMKGLNLAIDVGTNGEMVLGQNGRLLSCSTAAGPAFEGASIYQGMRATSGAIEGVIIKDGNVILKIIDNQKPIGICGSGLIDAVAQLLEVGIINHTGKLLDQDSANLKEIPKYLSTRLRKGKNGNEFVLAWGEYSEDIVITQKDIREVQLAKGAIYAGIVIMLKDLGEKVEDIDKIMIAGAFGNYIKKDSALRIGLFPNISPDKIISIGNGAGVGASMALLSITERHAAKIQARKVEHLELAGRDEFQTEYLKAMGFPKTNLGVDV